MTTPTKQILLAAIAAAGIAIAPAGAQNPGYAFGDLILGFQTTGSGSGSYVLANLGQAGTLRDATTSFTLGLSATALNNALIAQFGAGWFDRTDLYVGVFTAGSNDEFSGFFVNGDPYNTLYVGIPRQSIGANTFAAGTANSFAPMLAAGAVQNAANGMYNSAERFESTGTGAISTISSGVAFNDYNDENPISGGIQGASWQGEFAGGTQDVFGAGTFGTIGGISAEAAIDLYRVQGVNNQPGQFGENQPIGQGTYEGTIVIDNAGAVSLLVVPEPTSFGLLTAGAGLLGFMRRRRSLVA